MSVFQFIVNLIIAVVACSLVTWLLGFVSLPVEVLIQGLLWVVAVLLTFGNNAARKLGVE